MQEEAPGQVFWHPNGWTIYTTLQDYMRRKQRADGYVEVNTPQVVNRKLWEASGHWDKYQDHMFIVEVDEEHARRRRRSTPQADELPLPRAGLQPGLKSYRDLPLRMAEFGSCARYEPSGALHGIMRVRGFTQDDGHIFCTEDQIEAECAKFIDFLLGLRRSRLRASTSPSPPAPRSGSAPTNPGTTLRARWKRRSKPRATPTDWRKATAPSTARSWTST